MPDTSSNTRRGAARLTSLDNKRQHKLARSRANTYIPVAFSGVTPRNRRTAHGERPPGVRETLRFTGGADRSSRHAEVVTKLEASTRNHFITIFSRFFRRLARNLCSEGARARVFCCVYSLIVGMSDPSSLRMPCYMLCYAARWPRKGGRAQLNGRRRVYFWGAYGYM